MRAPPRPHRVVVFRHGPAALRDPARWPDDARRPLTAKGAEQTRRAAKGLARYVGPVGRLASSEAVRCRVTAECLRSELEPGPRIEYWAELAPGTLAPAIFDRLTDAVRRGKTTVLVGHEPTLTEFLGLALSGDGVPFVRLGKGAACCLDFPAGVKPGAAQLRWLLSRKQLSRLG